MKKIVFLIAATVAVVVIAAYSLFVFRTERFISSQSIVFKSEIKPLFNPKVENYFSSKCIDNKVEIEVDKNLNHKINKLLRKTKVGPVGIEPTTHRLKVCCSTD